MDLARAVPDSDEPSEPGPLWAEADAQPRLPFRGLTRGRLPECPGVYAIYRDGSRVYVGKAGNLRSRVGRHNGTGLAMRGSAFRRNVAQYLGIADANAIYTGAHVITAEQAQRVREWIEGCEVSWITRPNAAAAKLAEDEIKLEFKPPLTKV